MGVPPSPGGVWALTQKFGIYGPAAGRTLSTRECGAGYLADAGYLDDMQINPDTVHVSGRLHDNTKESLLHLESSDVSARGERAEALGGSRRFASDGAVW